MTRPQLARAAVGTTAVFPALVVVLNIIQRSDYHPFRQAVSELALGRDGWLMAVAFCSLATGTLFLAAMLHRLDSRPRVGPAIVVIAGALSYVSAFVHADGPHGSTTHGQIHQAVGIATFMLLIASMFAMVGSLRRDPRYRGLATPTLIWAFAAVGGFFLMPLSGSAHFGLAQRIFLAIVLSWALTISSRGVETRTTTSEAALAA